MQLPKCLRPYADRIEEVSAEGEDGYWVYLIPGWWSPENETHCIHEDTAKDCVPYLKSIEPCLCCKETQL